MTTDIPRRDPSVIPRGQFCYDTEHVPADPQAGVEEHWILHFERRCPYWQRTDHGTVRCAFLGVEHQDEYADDYHQHIEAYFGGVEAARAAVGRSLLYDEFKICGVNTEDDD